MSAQSIGRAVDVSFKRFLFCTDEHLIRKLSPFPHHKERAYIGKIRPQIGFDFNLPPKGKAYYTGATDFPFQIDQQV